MVRNEITEIQVKNIVKKYVLQSFKCHVVSMDRLNENMRLRDDLGFDSVDEFELIAALEKRFDIDIGIDNKLDTISDYINLVCRKVIGRASYTTQKPTVQEKIVDPEENLEKKPRKNVGVFGWFAKKMQKNKNTEKESDTLDEKDNEMMILQYLLFETSVNYQNLHDIIKSSFGANVPVERLQHIKSVESLMNVVKEYQK